MENSREKLEKWIIGVTRSTLVWAVSIRAVSIRIVSIRIVVLFYSLVFSGHLLAQWSHWRGPQENGVSTETDLPSSVEESILWRQPIAGGRSTPIVQGGRVVIATRAGEGVNEHELVVSYDGETGEVIWSDPINVFHTTIPGPRVAWAGPAGDPETGYVYFHGIEGIFNCYDRDGKLVWSRSLTEEFGRISGYGGRTNTPIVDEDRVVLSFLNSSWGDQGKGSHRFVAFDKKTGEVRWWSSPGGRPLDTTYSTPVITVVNGVRLLICGCADGSIYTLKSRTGETVWKFQLSKRGINVSPVVSGHFVYVSHSEENIDSTALGRVVCIDGRGTGDITKTGEVWCQEGVIAGYTSTVVHDGMLYVVDNSANLRAYKAADGHEIWEYSLGTVGKGSPSLGDGKIYVGAVGGQFHILKPEEKGCQSLSMHHFKTPEGKDNEIFGSPAIANGRVYFLTRDEVICLGKKKWSGKAGKTPALAEELSVKNQDEPSKILLIPGDVLLKPGDSVKFKAQLYNSRGQFLIDARAARWSLDKLRGSINKVGEFSVPPAKTYQSGYVKVQVGKLTASARVRIIPPLPISLDFENVKGKFPPGWIGLSPIKFKMTNFDGSNVLQKHGTSQRFFRALAFMGPPDLKSYTIQADIFGNYRRRTLPDMGLINQRYRLALMGVDQQLRVVTWVAQKRLEKNVLFEWKQDVWYRMKFMVKPGEKSTIIRGKVWPRGETEPGSWSIELEDPFPHRQGSPGIYAHTAGTTAKSHGTDVYFDNILIEENK